MKRLATATLAFLPTLLACDHQESPPNVVFILTDQWRSSGFGFAGDLNVKTPNLDRFASEALRFDNAVSVCPVCTPYRGSLLTGRYPTSTGMFLNDAYLPDEELCLAEVYREHGYQTAYIGKWHLDGHGRLDYTPPERRQGFDYWKALECSHDYNRMPFYEGDDAEMKHWEGYSPDAVCGDAGRYLASHAKNPSPFFLFVSIAAPHFPHHTAPDEFKELYPPEELRINPNVPEELRAKVRQELQGYYAHCTAIDRAVGRLLDQLKSLGLWERTVIVFTSDHGEAMGAHGVPATQKQVPWIESAGVPLLIHYPSEKKRKRRIFEMAVNTPDLSATLLDLSGIDVPESFEGVSFARNLKSGRDDAERGALYMTVSPFAAVPKESKREYRALKTARYTYVKSIEGPWLFYDDQNDPFQMNNLVTDPQHEVILERLDDRLMEELNRIGDDFRPAASYIREWGYTVQAAGHIAYFMHDQEPQKPLRR